VRKYELFAVEEPVCDELSGAESNAFVSLEMVSYRRKLERSVVATTQRESSLRKGGTH
jgi:hypothetical protein